MSLAQDETIPLGSYIFERLRNLGIYSIFGVPGDYNLHLLDYVQPAGLHWAGNCNELNAAYAADGYARIHGLSVVITTFGVGELSAINGIAGAYAEKVPVIHIVGSPSRSIQDSRKLVHHTFIDGEFRRFANMYAQVTVAQANLTDARLAPDQVDWIIEQAMIHQRPVYLQVPEDLADVPVSTANLRLRPTIAPAFPHLNSQSEHIEKILERICTAKQPLILVDGESRCMDVLDEIDQLIKATNWPTWTLPFGKGLVNEELPNVHGTYRSNYGDEASMTYLKSSDLILFFGPHLSNINTYAFTSIPDENATISFSQDHLKIDGDILRDVSAKPILQNIVQKLDPSRLSKVNGPNTTTSVAGDPPVTDLVCQEHFYTFVNKMFRPGDIVLTETGTASEGGQSFKLPRDTKFFTPATWLSIGYMLPATLGAALAQRDADAVGGNFQDHKKRVILFIGDGSLQMTAQEISTIVKENLHVIIFIINNEGYTVERAIHGRNAAYNDISLWNYSHTLNLFGLSEQDAARHYFAAKTWGELNMALESQPLRENIGVNVIEVFMGREDCVGELKELLMEQISREQKNE